MSRLLLSISPIFFDSLGVIAFAVLRALGVNTIVAVLAGGAAAVGLVGWKLLRRRSVPALQWISLVLVLVPAGAALLTHDPRLVMAKPTIVYLAVGVVMLRRGWMKRYLASYPSLWEEKIIDRFGFIWAGLMFFTALANLAVVMLATAWWTLFIAAFPFASKLGLFLVQYSVMRGLARRAVRRQHAFP
jgi:intracellular septation protein A